MSDWNRMIDNVDFGTDAGSVDEAGALRRRWIEHAHASVSCPTGRWGRRRVRVSECWAVTRVEELYTALLRLDASSIRPGARDVVFCKTRGGKAVAAGWEVTENSVWQRGRLFLLCARCDRRCTRLYQPVLDSPPRCRRCWGLTYASRTLLNYKDSLWGRGTFAKLFGTTQRDWAYQTTAQARVARRSASRERWAARRKVS